MQTLLIVLRLILAAVFATAGVGKLLDRTGSREALAGFGVPRSLTPSAAVALPVAELAVAAGLLVRPTAQWAAGAGVILLAAFIAGISLAMSRGQAPECHCFGQIHSSPAGAGTLARNASLGVVAGIVAAAGPGPALDGWASAGHGHSFVLGGFVALAITALAIARTVKTRMRAGQAAVEPPGLPLGMKAPEFEASDLHGGSVTLRSLIARGKPALLVFTHPSCPPCGDLLPHVARWQPAVAEHLTVSVISQGEQAENRVHQSQHGLAEMYVERNWETFQAYKMRGTPSAVLVSSDGRIGGATVSGPYAIEQLLRSALRRSQQRVTIDTQGVRAPLTQHRLAPPVEGPARA